MRVLFQKSHVKGYTRKDGVYVKDHETKQQSAHDYVQAVMQFPPAGHKPPPKPGPAQMGMLFPAKPPPKPEAYHPQPGENGKRVPIFHQHQPSEPATWYLPHCEATCVPGGALPPALNGVPFAPWQAPTTADGWNSTSGLMPLLQEPPFDPGKLEPAAGVVIEEDDGRVWLVCPTNRHAGYRATYPKGHAEAGLSLQATALKEAFEESGLQAEITGYLGDFSSGMTLTRYYRARRVGGTPAAMGWESQAVQLVPCDELVEAVNNPRDKAIAAQL